MNKLCVKKDWICMIVAFIFVFTSLVNISYAGKPQKDTVAPSSPTNLRAVTINDKSISLAWDPSKDNNRVSSYYVYIDDKYIGTSSATTYTVSGLSPATTYELYVKARDAAGNLSNSSNIIKITTLNSSTPTSTPSS